ncbi:dihydroxyacid dehydratase [Apiospora rasikravindrae]|uniref:Dihydroxyacid dehydratase n=1 Tax=Apiospora rasikravindrae TaxID=990691 RepID=A0ABR1TGW2_9PEZI
MEQEYDLLILTDATGSMHQYLPALRQALPKIVSVSCLTDAFSRIGIMAYRDYEQTLTEWSGWHNCRGDNNKDDDVTREALIDFAKGLRLGGGYDWDEAVKTGAAHAYSVMRPEAITLIMLYADAPPHMRWHEGPNVPLEQENLKADAFGVGTYFVDWVSACRTLSGKTHAPKYAKPVRSQVFCIIDNSRIATVAPFAYLSHATGGSCFWMRQAASSTTIASLTMNILLTWMGAGKQGATVPETHVATSRLMRYLKADDFEHMRDEADERISKYMPPKSLPSYVYSSKGTIDVVDVQDHSMKQLIQPRATSIPDFSKRYTQDQGYAKLVVEHLRKIIDEDITSITINPVFGSLWRTVCNDRNNPARNELLERFSAGIQEIVNKDDKERITAWLEESYNFAAEIEAIIKEVADEDRFPCVFLDPTQVWAVGTDQATQGDDDQDATVATWTRADLLEIGRSCHPKILRRLGRALTRLSYVSSADEMPEHVRDMPQNELIRMPLALAKAKYQRVFWKALLHLVVPGTKLSGRAASVLAALSIRMGIKPLLDAADQQMFSWKENWNNLEVPETWNTNCMSLLLDADASYAERHKKRKAEDSAYTTLLKPSDRKLFELLVDYSLLKANMDTSLTARIGWHPEKTRVPVGPLVLCKECHFPRSVTIMASEGICGLCLKPDTDYTRKSKPDVLQLNVSKDDDISTEITWVECCNVDCRAQYVVYDSEGLNVRAKCHFCRRGKTSERAPTIECSKCLSRIIWPDEYRPEDLEADIYECPACVGGYKTITVSAAAALEDFADKVEVLPQSHEESLSLGGKTVRNAEDIKACLLGWIKSRKAESGTCNLCFRDFKKQGAGLRRACGRSGCPQQICTGCHAQWYSTNKPGCLINVAALTCPFCRRQPSPKVAPRNLVALANLRDAVQESGSWLYSWCVRCGHAKRFAERVCARGAPSELTGWCCDDCQPTVAAASKGETGEIFKECPSCGVATEKTGGCNHMTCVCGAEWCFVCGEQGEDSQAVYAHMSESHGGWYGVDGGDDEFELYGDGSDDELEVYL